MNTHADNIFNITFLITMDLAFKLFTDGILTLAEYRRYAEEMCQKYDCENVRILYQSKLDIYLDQSVNSDTKGEPDLGNH